MKRLITFVFLLFFLTACNEVKVMSYNIHAMRGMDGTLDAQRIADVILAEDPDLVGLQEVDHLTERSGKMDVLSFFEDHCGMHVVYRKTFDYQGGAFGNMVLSRYPVIETKEVRLPSRMEYEPRLLMMVSVRTERGDTLHFYNTHLDHHAGDSDRPAQMRRITEELAADGQKIILLGDLNCQPGSEPLERLGRYLSRCGSEEKTYPADDPERVIDHIYYSPGRGLQCREIRVIPETTASDHRPLTARFRIRK